MINPLPPTGSVDHTPPPLFVTQFVRFWCCNMDTVHAAKMEWPGFGYTDAEKAEMNQIAQRVTGTEKFLLFGITTVLTIVCGALLIGVMFGALTVMYPDPSKTPASIFFFFLANVCLATLTGGLIGAIIIAGWVSGKLIAPTAESLPPTAFVRELFPKVVWQIVRITAIMVIVALAYWLFVPTGSKLDLFVRGIAPMLSPTVAVLSLLMYVAGRVGRRA